MARHSSDQSILRTSKPMAHEEQQLHGREELSHPQHHGEEARAGAEIPRLR